MSRHATYQLSAVEAVAVLRFRCQTIKFPGSVDDARCAARAPLAAPLPARARP